VTTGLSPVTGQVFDRSVATSCSMSMQRKANSKISKDEARLIATLLNYLVDEAGR